MAEREPTSPIQTVVKCSHCNKETQSVGMWLGKDVPFCDDYCRQVYSDAHKKEYDAYIQEVIRK